MSKKQKQAAGTTGAPTGAAVVAAGPVTQEVVKAQEAPAPAMLFGSSVQPAVLHIGGQEIQIGTIVAAAHKASELTVEDWNALTAEVREELIADELSELLAAETKKVEAAEAAAAEAAAAEAVEKPGYPRQITLRNHSGFAVSEPATGAFVGGGASAHATVHDEAQAVRVLQNVQTIKSRTGGRQSLVVIGLDDVVIPEETGDAP